MTNKIANFELSEIATSDFKHPLLKRVRFVFADDKPNRNNQGIEYEDFEAVKQSAIDMPIKLRFLGEAGAGGHVGSVTIGHIQNIEEDQLEDGTHRLIANGVVYASEYPSEVKYLEQSFAEGKAPGASWEMSYHDIKQDGPVSWLKGIITSAATFVRNPAYGTRTALLALASDERYTDAELKEELLTIIEDIRPKNDIKGGSNTVEEELKKLQAELADLKAEKERLTEENKTLSTAKTDLETAKAELETKVEDFERKNLIADRTAKVTEAGLAVAETDLERKQAYWTSLSETAFAEYLEDIKAMKALTPKEEPKKALASLNNDLPRPNPALGVETLSIEELKGTLRNKSRGVTTD